jgi:lipopolysaccharide heptosyltransferase II
MAVHPLWDRARNILCVRLDDLGDVLMTTPAFRALRTSFPSARLTLLTSTAGAGIARFIPEVDAVIEFDAPWVKQPEDLPDEQPISELVSRLKTFDAAVIFTVFSQNPLPAAFLCCQAGIPLRLAYCRENPYGLLTDWVPDLEPFSGIAHEVLRQLNLVKTIGAETEDERLSLTVSHRMKLRAQMVLSRAGLNHAMPWLVLHPGVRERKRQYPPEAFADAGNRLAEQGFQVVITGAPSETELTDALADTIPNSVSLGSALSLSEFIGVIAQAPLVISNNSGPVHIAAALGTPVVALYAMTNPQHVPWNVPHRVLYFDVPRPLRSRDPLLLYSYQTLMQQPVRDAQPEDIVQAVYDLLQERLESRFSGGQISGKVFGGKTRSDP